MSDETLLTSEYEALRAEERDRMNARLQVWTIWLSLIGAFGFLSLQGDTLAYAAALYPFLTACLARHVGHSEEVLRQIRKYLYRCEQRLSYEGYEHFTRTQPRPSHGGYLAALQQLFLLTQLVATILVVGRLILGQLLWVGVVVALGEIALMVLTYRWVRR